MSTLCHCLAYADGPHSTPGGDATQAMWSTRFTVSRYSTRHLTVSVKNETQVADHSIYRLQVQMAPRPRRQTRPIGTVRMSIGVSTNSTTSTSRWLLSSVC